MIVISAAAALLALQGAGLGGPAASAAGWQAGATRQASAFPALAPNEVLLELAAMGSDSSPADLAEIRVTLKARGKSEEAARAAYAALLNRVREAARAAGVSASEIEAGDLDVGPDMEASMTDLMEPMRPLRPGQSAEATEEPFAATSTMKLRIRNVRRLQGLTEAIEKAGGEMIGSPQFSAEDTAAARRGARRKAIAQARVDAETYAAALSMKVVRILRVTERTGTDMMTMMLSEMAGGVSGMSEMFEGDRDGRVPALVFVGVDFVLAPR